MSRVIGIDLGTSTCEVSILENGKPIIIPNLDGEKITPSVVGISDDNEIVVGKNARDQLLLKPNETIIEIKRQMGSQEKVKMGEGEYTPQKISAYILEYLKKSAEKYLDEAVERAVITVPAYFTDKQRKATVEAGKLAGLKVERIINEPTAAALAYGIEHMEDCNYALVYDLGGGTLDVTVLEMFSGVLEVKASSGNNKLGGKDFDDRLMNELLKQFESENAINLRDNIHALARIKDAAETCKIALSTQEEYKIGLPFITKKGNDPIALENRVLRQQFNNMIEDLVDSTRLSVEKALKDASLSVDDIDVVLLVGGSTRVPLVKEFLKKTLNKEPNALVDPDLAVAQGAAIQAAIINKELSSKKDILITDVCPYTLGTKVMNFRGGFIHTDVYDVLINRNTTIPVVKEKIYSTSYDYQEKVEIKVYQGDNVKASKNNFLGKFMLSGIPASPAFKEKVKIKFAYDVNGILQVEGIIMSTKEKAGITLETTGVEMEEELDLSKWEEAPKARKYRSLIRRADRMIKQNEDNAMYDDLLELIYNIKKSLIKEEDEKLKELEENINDLLYDMEEYD